MLSFGRMGLCGIRRMMDGYLGLLIAFLVWDRCVVCAGACGCGSFSWDGTVVVGTR